MQSVLVVTKVVSSIPHRGNHKVYMMQLLGIKFEYDFRKITWFSTVFSTNKPDVHNITEILTEEAASSVSALYSFWSFGVSSVCAFYWLLAFCIWSGRNHQIINIKVVIVANQEYWRSCICVLEVSVLPLSTISRLHLGIVSTLFVFHFISQISLATDYTGLITFINRYNDQISMERI